MRFRFTGEGGEIDVLASYTPNDPFYELVTALQAILEFGSSRDVEINLEPEEVVLTLEKVSEKLKLTLSDKQGAKRTCIEASFQTACREIARNIHHLYNEIGYAGFVKDWRRRPPKERIQKLWAEING